MKVRLSYRKKATEDVLVEVPDTTPTPVAIYHIPTKSIHVLANIGNEYIYDEVAYGICNENIVVLHDVKS